MMKASKIERLFTQLKFDPDVHLPPDERRRQGGRPFRIDLPGVNRAPVVTEVPGFEHEEALTLGRAVAGLNAYSKELIQPTPKGSKNSGGRFAKKKP